MSGGGGTFHWPLRLLGAGRREAAMALYRFCRAVDDIADGEGPLNDRQAALNRWRDRVLAAAKGAPAKSDQALARAMTDFGVRVDDLLAIIDGMAMDLNGPIIAPDLPTLRLYCARVAGAVGRSLLRIFGHHGPDADLLADTIGEALQLTNILRDIDEDAARGRLYLPRDALDSAGVAATTPAAVIDDPALPAACAWLSGRAHVLYGEGAGMLAKANDRRLWPAVAMMALYRRVLVGLEARGWDDRADPMRLSQPVAAWISIRAALGLRVH